MFMDYLKDVYILYNSLSLSIYRYILDLTMSLDLGCGEFRKNMNLQEFRLEKCGY